MSWMSQSIAEYSWEASSLGGRWYLLSTRPPGLSQTYPVVKVFIVRRYSTYRFRTSSHHPLPSGSNVVIQLMEEILHQLIGGVSHYLQGFTHPRWLVGFLPSTVRVFSHVVKFFFPVVDQFQVNRFNPLSYSKMSTWLKSWFGACVFVNFPVVRHFSVSTYQTCGCISIGLLNTSNIQCSISAIQQNGLKFTAKTQGPIYIQSL